MKDLKFELFITYGQNQENFILGDSPLLIGSGSNCNIIIGENEPRVKAVIQKQKNFILIKSFDPKFAVDINGKKYKSAKIKQSKFIKVGPVDIVVSVEEIDTQSISTTSSRVHSPADLPDFLDDDIKDEVVVQETAMTKDIGEATGQINIPSIPAVDDIIPDEDFVLHNTPISSPALDSTIESIQEDKRVDSNSIIEDVNIFNFNTTFSDEFDNNINYLAYNTPLSFENYIDPKDETLTELPSEDIAVKVNGYCVQVTHQSNGTVLHNEFFDLKLKKLFISNFYSDSKTVKIHDCNEKRSELLYVRDNKVQLVNLKNYSIQKVNASEKVEIQSEATIQILKGEHVILTKGTSQIIIKLVAYPPKLKSKEFFDIDEKLLKNVFTTWAMVIIPLLIMLMIVESPKEQEKIKKEMVIIYKRKKIIEKEPIELKPTPVVVETALEQVSPMVKKESPEPKPAKTTPVKKVSKVKKVVKKKTAKSITKRPRKTVKKIVIKPSKSIVKATVKKSYKFSSSSLMSATLGDSNAEFKNVKDVSVDATSALGKSNKISNSFDSREFGTSKNKISRFSAGKAIGKRGLSGTKGLSGKTDATTAYVEANTKILGAMDPELIRKLMREHIPDFRFCYQRELLINPTVAGVFDLKFQINKNGKGIRVGVKNNGKSFSSNAKRCIKRVVSLIKFPRPKGGGTVDVKQPMNFNNL